MNSDVIADLNNLCDKLGEFVREIDQVQSRQVEFIRRKVRSCVGDETDLLYQDEGTAHQCLNDPRPNHRLGSLLVLVFHWGPTRKLVQAAARLLTVERVPEIRNLAITAIGNCYKNTQNVEVCHLLRLLSDAESEVSLVRRAARIAHALVMGPDGDPLEEFVRLVDQTERELAADTSINAE